MRSACVLAVLLVGCGATAPARTTTTSSDMSCAVDDWTAGESRRPESVTLRREAPVRRIRHTVRIRRPLERLESRGPRIDVQLERARLSNALRLLADAADLGIVIGEGLDTRITVDLRRVRPVEAMRALAQAHDIDLRVIGRTVVARRRNGS